MRYLYGISIEFMEHIMSRDTQQRNFFNDGQHPGNTVNTDYFNYWR